MYSYSADEIACVGVSIWSGEQTDADYERSIAVLQRIDRLAAERGVQHVQIVLVADGFKPPPAVWRKRISEVNRGFVCSSYYFGFVTRSAVIRGVFTAIRWLIGARHGHYSAAFGTFAEAASWARKNTGNTYPQLESHYAKALEAAGLTSRDLAGAA
jgi:hypothetical protein